MFVVWRVSLPRSITQRADSLQNKRDTLVTPTHAGMPFFPLLLSIVCLFHPSHGSVNIAIGSAAFIDGGRASRQGTLKNQLAENLGDGGGWPTAAQGDRFRRMRWWGRGSKTGERGEGSEHGQGRCLLRSKLCGQSAARQMKGSGKAAGDGHPWEV